MGLFSVSVATQRFQLRALKSRRVCDRRVRRQRTMVMAVNLHKHQKNLVYRLSQQYLAAARDLAADVRSEKQLQQYYTLVRQCVHGLRYVKDGFQLTVEEDIQVTLQLARVLLEETHEVELAEQYLGSLRTRLRTTPLTDARHAVEFQLLYDVPLAKEDRAELRQVVRHTTGLLEELADSDAWAWLFRYCRIIGLEAGGARSNSAVLQEYLKLQQLVSAGPVGLHAFVLCSCVAFILDRVVELDRSLLTQLRALRKAGTAIPLQLQMWSLLLDLLVAIQLDENIMDLLTDFKDFFSTHKDALKDGDDTVVLSIKEGVNVRLFVPLFNYHDCKNILLLFQSVSYLTTCYSKSSNFSTKFLPKVLKTSQELKETLQKRTSLVHVQSIRNIYDKVVDLCRFYQTWESLILSERVEGGIPRLQYSEYNILLEAISSQQAQQADLSHVGRLYSTLTKSKDPELRLIGIAHLYTLIVAELSSCSEGPEGISELTQKTTDAWEQLQHAYLSSSLVQNNVWKCSVAILWAISRFEPFSGHPIHSSSNDQQTLYMQQLNEFFTDNALVGTPEAVPAKDFKLKKSLLLHFLLNYLGGTMLVSDVQKRCDISSSCFQMGKQQYMPGMRYVAGIWHLMNSTVAMKTKEVAITRAKLEGLVDKMLNS
ncbi:FAGR133Cp [Eremothecium gossypii FDAG1]|nr:FAGR133Cp [Eremothecium gossypii FDAG1]